MILKFITVTLLLAILLDAGYCTPVLKKSGSLIRNNRHLVGSIEEQEKLISPLSSCENCYEFAVLLSRAVTDGAIDIYIMDSCLALCYEIVLHYNTSIKVEIICNSLCDAVGIEKFKDIASHVDMGPITLCEVLKVCEVNDYGDAKLTKVAVSPSSGPQGVFVVDFEYNSLNGTGTGELGIIVVTADDVPYQYTYLNVAKQPGTYNGNITINAVPNHTCEIDPHWFGPCEKWIPGHYLVTIAICEGECFGSDEYPHTKLYDKIITNFTITN